VAKVYKVLTNKYDAIMLTSPLKRQKDSNQRTQLEIGQLKMSLWSSEILPCCTSCQFVEIMEQFVRSAVISADTKYFSE